MPEAYDLHESRLVQQNNSGSAADALLVDSAAVPAGKVWTIIRADVKPSAAETQVYCFQVFSATGLGYTVTLPMSVALGIAYGLPLLEQGNEMKLFPGDRLRARRAAATAGSNIVIYYEYIETDLPYYSYVEPLNKVVKAKIQHGSAFRSSGSLSTGSPGSGGGPGPIDRGGKGGVPQPV